MRLAVVTPLDTRSTGVADYSRDLLPHLARAAGETITVYSGDAILPPNLVCEGWTWRPIGELARDARRFDLIIYQMGNSPAHDFITPFLLRQPGLVVLHDISLHYCYARQVVAGRPSLYFRAFGFGYGVEGTQLGWRYLQQGATVAYPDYLLSEWLAIRSPGVIVHSQHAFEILAQRCPAARIWQVPMPMPLPALISRTDARARLGLNAEDLLIIIFGVLNLSKKPLVVLDALSRLRAAHIPARAVFLGVENSPFRLQPEVEERRLEADVIHLGYVPDLATARLWMFAADVGVGLRSPYWGETPSSALRIMATGTPMIVSEVGALVELPDAACIKIAPDMPDEAGALYLALKQLYEQPDRRQAMGTAARAYVAERHDPDKVAIEYLKVVDAIIDG